MLDVKNVVEYFLLSLPFGLTLFSVLASSKMTGVGFIKLVSSVCFVALALATGTHAVMAHWSSPQGITYFILLALTGLTYAFHKDDRSWFMWLIYAAQIVLYSYQLLMFHNFYMPIVLFFLSSTLLMGVITYSMILGHWYLVVPRLSEKPLAVGMIITWIVLGLKILYASWFVFGNMEYFESGTTKGAGYMFNWVMLTMRVGWGYLVIAVMSWYGWRLIRMRSTQSATGILYAMTFFVLAGELVSTYLYFKYGMKI